jgi:hypothetical protein
MHLRAKPPIFVPEQFRTEIESLSKAPLMDLVWDFAAMRAGAGLEQGVDGDDATMKVLREQIEIVQTHRRQAA